MLRDNKIDRKLKDIEQFTIMFATDRSSGGLGEHPTQTACIMFRKATRICSNVLRFSSGQLDRHNSPHVQLLRAFALGQEHPHRRIHVLGRMHKGQNATSTLPTTCYDRAMFGIRGRTRNKLSADIMGDFRKFMLPRLGLAKYVDSVRTSYCRVQFHSKLSKRRFMMLLRSRTKNQWYVFRRGEIAGSSSMRVS